MTLEDYSNQLLKIAKSHDGEYGTCCELDLSQEEHFKCVEYLFGGKELFEKNYPKSYKSAMLSKEYKGEKILNENQKAGFKDVTDLLYVTYDKNEKVLSACGTVYLTHSSPQIYMSIIVMRAEKQIGFRTASDFGTSVLEIDIKIPNVEIEEKNEVTILIQSMWQNDKTNTLKSQITPKTSTNLEDIVENNGITMTHPVHRDRTPKPAEGDDIIVVYGRTTQVQEIFDYDYPIARTLDNLQKMYLDVEGTVKFKEGVSGIIFNSGALKMNTVSYGAIIYKNTPLLVNKNVANREFKFKFDKDWLNTIPSSSLFTSLMHYFHLVLFFTANNKDYTVHICSKDDPDISKSSNHLKTISNFSMYWGCFLEGTLISMADGTPKKIQDIVKGDKVKSKDGKSASVKATLKGDNDPIIYTMRLFNGKEVKATETHPFMTKSGMKPLIDLVQDEKILLEDGTYSTVEYIYPTKGSFTVYNLILEGDDRVVFANGIAAGDNTAQNTSYAPLMKSLEVDEDIVNEIKKLKEYHEKMNL